MRWKTSSLPVAALILSSVSFPVPVWAQLRAPAAVGEKLAEGQAYAAAVQLAHQADREDNGRMLLSFEENGMEGIPLYESRDNGKHWQFVMHATDPGQADHSKCNLHWQPHLTEMPRTVGELKAGTVLLSASSVCNGDNGRMASMQLQLYASSESDAAGRISAR